MMLNFLQKGWSGSPLTGLKGIVFAPGLYKNAVWVSPAPNTIGEKVDGVVAKIEIGKYKVKPKTGEVIEFSSEDIVEIQNILSPSPTLETKKTVPTQQPLSPSEEYIITPTVFPENNPYKDISEAIEQEMMHIHKLMLSPKGILESTAKGYDNYINKEWQEHIDDGESVYFLNEDKFKTVPYKGTFSTLNYVEGKSGESLTLEKLEEMKKKYKEYDEICKEEEEKKLLHPLLKEEEENKGKSMPNLLDEMNATTLKVIKANQPNHYSPAAYAYMMKKIKEEALPIEGGTEIKEPFTMATSSSPETVAKVDNDLYTYKYTMVDIKETSKYTQEEITAAFTLAPSIINILKSAGVQNPSIELFSDGSGHISLYGGTTNFSHVELAKSLVDGYLLNEKHLVYFSGGLIEAAKNYNKNKPQKSSKKTVPTTTTTQSLPYITSTKGQLTLEDIQKALFYLNSLLPNTFVDTVKVHPKTLKMIGDLIIQLPQSPKKIFGVKLLPNMNMSYSHIDFYIKDKLVGRLIIEKTKLDKDGLPTMGINS